MVSISEALQAAVKFHQVGKLAEAERLYREILESNARHADAWHLLGLIAYQRSDWPTAEEYIARAIQLDGAQPSFHNHLAEVFRSAGNLAKSETCCREALKLKPDFALAHNTLGIVLNEQGQTEQAISCFQKAIAAQPDFAQAHCNLGAALQTRGNTTEAIACFRRAIECLPDYAAAYSFLGSALQQQGSTDEALAAYRQAITFDPRLAQAEKSLGALLQSRLELEEARACYERALVLQPADAESLCNLGSIFKEQGQHQRAIEYYQRAIQVDPGLAEAHFNLGVIYQQRRELAPAADCYERAIRHKTNYAQAHNNLGAIRRQQGDLAAAIQCFHQALELKPNFAEALNNLGNTFKIQDRHAEAAVCYQQALRINPEYAQVHYNHALAQLAVGEFAAGWPEYEWRWRCPDFPRASFSQPLWDGTPLGARTLLVHAEQGLGDTLQFARYVPLLKQFGGQVVFEVQPPLAPLLAQSGFVGLVSKGDALPRFDVHFSLMSLPLIFATTIETIPVSVPYLAAEPKLAEHWRDVLRGFRGMKVGIAWQGSKTYPNDRFRSIPLMYFAPLAQAGVDLISLQKGAGSEQLADINGKFHVHDLGDIDRQHGAFTDTAAILQNLDVLVTSDSAIAHLAGGLGIKTWLALPLAPDWRWMFEREDCPWYPNMRLFRQTSFDDWSDVFARIAAELAREQTKCRQQ